VAGANQTTSRDLAEPALAEREERLRLAADAAQLGIWDADLATGEITWDERHARLFGYEPCSRGSASAHWSRLHPDDRARVADEVRRARSEGSDLDVEYRVVLPDNQVRWMASTGRVFRDARGEAARMLGVVRDVTDLHRAREESERVSAFREQLIAIVGHDLRNPLTAIMAAGSLLSRLGQLDERQSYALARIVSSAARMERLIADLLDLSRGRLGSGLPIAPRCCDLREIARQVCDELQIANPTRPIRLALDGEGAGEWDPERLSQALSNLVGNALQHSPDGSEIAVHLLGSERAVIFAVRSEGEPIPPELQPSIFESFRAGRAPGVGGMGLGLYIVRQIVVAHGGTVEVSSDPAAGTTFTVALPRRAAPAVL
jgi:PAS domain S-box-containing protein